MSTNQIADFIRNSELRKKSDILKQEKLIKEYLDILYIVSDQAQAQFFESSPSRDIMTSSPRTERKP